MNIVLNKDDLTNTIGTLKKVIDVNFTESDWYRYYTISDNNLFRYWKDRKWDEDIRNHYAAGCIEQLGTLI